MSIFIQILILKSTLVRNWTLSRCEEMGVMMKSVSLSSSGFPEVAEIIIFVEGNRIHVDPKFGERGHSSVMLVPNLHEETTIWLLEYACCYKLSVLK